MNKEEIIKRLVDGNTRFASDSSISEHKDAEWRKKQLEGQHPFAVILSCADSRVVPEFAFDTGIGDIFVVREAGNIANISSVASIEYAVANLEIQVIIVLAHENCGAVTAATSGGDLGHNLNHLLSHITHAVEETGDNATVNEIAKKNAIITVEKLVAKSSIISKAVESNQLVILPAYYHLDTGIVDFLC